MIAAILSVIWPYLLAGIGAVAAAFGIYTKCRSDAKAKADAKNLKRAVEAKEEQLKMRREADEAERRARALSDEEARKEAERWASKR